MTDEDKEIMKECASKIAKIMMGHDPDDFNKHKSIGMTHYIEEYDLWLHVNLNNKKPSSFTFIKED